MQANSVKGKGDPLLGEQPPMPKGTEVPASPTRFTKPPSPGTRPSTSVPASLVSHTAIPNLEGAKPLAIEAGWQRDYGAAPSPSGPKVMPVPLEKSATPGVIPTGGWTADAGKVTPLGGDPIARLESLGAIGIRQEPVAGGVHVSCFTQSRTNPGATRFHEATGANVTQAVEAIVGQLSRE